MNQKSMVLATAAVLSLTPLAAQSVPVALQGQWRVERVMARAKSTCWDAERARQLVGTTLRYSARTLRWQGGEVPLLDQVAVVRTLNDRSFAAEYGVPLQTLGVHLSAANPSIREVNLQHEDADVTGGSTEVPGDTVLLAAPSRIVFSACGVYYEAVRTR